MLKAHHALTSRARAHVQAVGHARTQAWRAALSVQVATAGSGPASPRSPHTPTLTPTHTPRRAISTEVPPGSPRSPRVARAAASVEASSSNSHDGGVSSPIGRVAHPRSPLASAAVASVSAHTHTIAQPDAAASGEATEVLTALPTPPPPAPTPSMLDELARSIPGSSTYNSYVYDPAGPAPYRLWWLDPEGSMYQHVIGLARTSAGVLHWLHDASGLPWWATIIAAGALVRAAVFPFTLYSLRNASRAADARTDITAVQRAYHRARVAAGDHISPTDRIRLAVYLQRGMRAALEKAKCYPLRSLAMPFVQVPIVLAGVLGARHSVLLGDESFEREGALWFHDLTVPDSTYILPAASIALAYLSLEVMFGRGTSGKATSGGAALLGADIGNKVKSAFQIGILMSTPFLAELPAGLYLLMSANSAWTIAYLKAVRSPSIYKALTGRDLPRSASGGATGSALAGKVMYPDLVLPGITHPARPAAVALPVPPLQPIPQVAAARPGCTAMPASSSTPAAATTDSGWRRAATPSEHSWHAAPTDAAQVIHTTLIVPAAPAVPTALSLHAGGTLEHKRQVATLAAGAMPVTLRSSASRSLAIAVHRSTSSSSGAAQAASTPLPPGNLQRPVDTASLAQPNAAAPTSQPNSVSMEELRAILSIPRIARADATTAPGAAPSSPVLDHEALESALKSSLGVMNAQMPMVIGHPNPFILRLAGGRLDSPLNALRQLPRSVQSTASPGSAATPTASGSPALSPVTPSDERAAQSAPAATNQVTQTAATTNAAADTEAGPSEPPSPGRTVVQAVISAVRNALPKLESTPPAPATHPPPTTASASAVPTNPVSSAAAPLASTAQPADSEIHDITHTARRRWHASLSIPVSRDSRARTPRAAPAPAATSHSTASAINGASVDVARVYAPSIGLAAYAPPAYVPQGGARIHSPQGAYRAEGESTHTLEVRHAQSRVDRWNLILDHLEGQDTVQGTGGVTGTFSIPTPTPGNQGVEAALSPGGRSSGDGGAPPSAPPAGGAAGGGSGDDGRGSSNDGPVGARAAERAAEEAGTDSEVDVERSDARASDSFRVASSGSASDSSSSSLSTSTSDSSEMSSADDAEYDPRVRDSRREWRKHRATARREARQRGVPGAADDRATRAVSKVRARADAQADGNTDNPVLVDSVDATSARVNELLAVQELPPTSRRKVRKWTRMMRDRSKPAVSASGSPQARARDDQAGLVKPASKPITAEELLGYNIADELAKIAFGPVEPPASAKPEGDLQPAAPAPGSVSSQSKIDADTWRLLLGDHAHVAGVDTLQDSQPRTSHASRDAEHDSGSDAHALDDAAHAIAAGVAPDMDTLRSSGHMDGASAASKRRNLRHGDEAKTKRIMRGILLEDGTFIASDDSSASRKLKYQPEDVEDVSVKEAQIVGETKHSAGAHGHTEEEAVADVQTSSDDAQEALTAEQVDAALLTSEAHEAAEGPPSSAPTEEDKAPTALVPAKHPHRRLSFEERRDHVISALALLDSPEYTSPGRADLTAVVSSSGAVDENANFDLGFGKLIGHGAASIIRKQHPRAAEVLEQQETQATTAQEDGDGTSARFESMKQLAGAYMKPKDQQQRPHPGAGPRRGGRGIGFERALEAIRSGTFTSLVRTGIAPTALPFVTDPTVGEAAREEVALEFMQRVAHAEKEASTDDTVHEAVLKRRAAVFDADPSREKPVYDDASEHTSPGKVVDAASTESGRQCETKSKRSSRKGVDDADSDDEQ